MMDDRTGRTNSDSVVRRANREREVTQQVDSGEISPEVKAYLDETHPLRQRRERVQARETYMNRSSEREDVEEVREARMQRVGTEIEGIRRQPQQEGDPTRYVSRRARNSSPENKEKEYTMSEIQVPPIDESDSRVPYVSVMPPRRKPRNMEEGRMQTNAPQRRPQRRPEGMETREMQRPAPPRKTTEIPRGEHLDTLYGDEYDDDYEGRMGKIIIIVGIVAVLLIAFLMYRNISYSAQIEELQAQVDQNAQISEDYSTWQTDKQALEEQIEELKKAAVVAPEVEEGAEGGASTSAGAASSSSAATGTVSGDSYTVVAGDSMWGIATKVYGDGTRFNEILTANGLSESDNLSVGQVLVIPR